MEAAVLDPGYWKTVLSQSASILKQQTAHLDPLDPWFSLILFMAASVVMIWRLEALEEKGFAIYYSIERLVAWIPRTGPGFFVFENLGWLSGILMVLPNGMVALYYAKAQRADVVYTSQIGDGHICIPMCVGLFALFNTIQAPAQLNLSVGIILVAGLLHFAFVAFWGGYPEVPVLS